MEKELSVVVNMKEDVTRRDICSCASVGSGLKAAGMTSDMTVDTTVEMKPDNCIPDGRIHRVSRKNMSRLIFARARANENFRDRNVSSPINLQLTVHLKRNCRVNSKARPK